MKEFKLEYDEFSPLTNEKTVLVEDLDDNLQQKICMSSGYYTTSDWQEAGESVANYMEQITSHNIKNSYVDDYGLVWFPYLLTTETATIFADDIDGCFTWFVMPVEKQEDGSYCVVDEGTKHFPSDGFVNALNYFFTLSMGV